MKTLFIRLAIFSFLSVPVLFLASCDGTQGSKGENADLSINEHTPALALTIGWYLPLDYLQKIVGPDFTPKVAKSDTLGVLKLVITEGDQYFLKGENKGKFNSAILLIEVNEPKGIFKAQPKTLDNAYVCPVTIVSESLPMAKLFHEYGFVTEQSVIDLKITESDDRINVDAKINAGENTLTARCFFNELPVDERAKVMVVNQTRPVYRNFHGNEKYIRYTNGRGRLDAEGTTILTSLGIQNIPFFFMLDRERSWSYNFE